MKTKQSLYLSFKEHSVLKFLVIDHGEYSVLSLDVGHEVFDCILLVFSISGVNLLCVTLQSLMYYCDWHFSIFAVLKCLLKCDKLTLSAKELKTVKYLLQYLDRYIDRCIGWYINCYSINSWVTCSGHVDPLWTESQLMFKFGRASTDVRWGIDCDHIGMLLANYWWDISQVFAECRSCIINLFW